MAIQKVGVLGSGQVGQVLANGFLRHGYDVMIGSRTPSKLSEWKAGAGEHGQIGSFEETAKFGDVIVLAVQGSAAEAVVQLAGIANLKGKTVIDATNPIAGAPPEHGVLQFFTDLNESLMERLQALCPEAYFVKAFSCVGNAWFVNPDFPGGPPTMFICGNHEPAKLQVTAILEQFGWEWEDMGFCGGGPGD